MIVVYQDCKESRPRQLNKVQLPLVQPHIIYSMQLADGVHLFRPQPSEG